MSLIKKTTASFAIVALASGLFANGASAYSTADVDAANRLADAGVIVKQSNPADYQLDRNVLRQEIAAVARGIAKIEKKATCSNSFKDVSATKPNTWACFSIEALLDAGLIAKNTNFRPESNITKAESIGMVVKAAYGNEYTVDPSKGDWQKQVVEFAANKGIITSFTDYTTPATRSFIFNAADKAMGLDKKGNGEDLLCKILGECGKTTDPKTPEQPKTPDQSKNNVRNDNNLAVSLSPESPANGYVVAKTDRAVLLAFDVTAGKSDVTLKKASLKFTGLWDHKIIENLAIYSNDIKITKGEKTFNNKLVADLSFDRSIVVRAGETKTLFVTATVNPGGETYNQTIRVSLTGLEADATVTGADLTGATLTPSFVSNKGKYTLTTTADNGRLNLGEEQTIYNFSIKEKDKREDIVLKNVTFEEGDGNNADLDNLADLVLEANGKKIDAKFTYQKSKIIATTDYTIKGGEKVNFRLRGKATDDLNKTLELKLDNVYLVGATTKIAASEDGTSVKYVSKKEITGTAVNFAFNREGSNEVSKNTTDVKIGELVFASKGDYTAKLKVTVTGPSVTNKYEDLEIDGSTGKKLSDNVYEFTDININKGTTKIPMTVDVTNNAQDNDKIKFTVEVTQLEENGVGTKLSGSSLGKVLNNSQLSKEVSVIEAGFKLTAERVNTTRVVPKGNQEVVLYKGRIDLSGGEDITVDNLILNKASGSENLLDYISGTTLNIGGKTFTGDVNNDTINFSSISAKIQKNSKSVQVLVTATLKDKELTSNKTLQVYPGSVSVSSENSNNLTARIVETNFGGGLVSKSATMVNLTVNSGLRFEASTAANLKDDVLAGAPNAELAVFKVKDTSSEITFNTLKFKFDTMGNPNTLASALTKIRLMDGAKEIASGGTVDGNYVVFSSVRLPQDGKDRVLKLVADLNKYSSAGGDSGSYIGKLRFTEVEHDTTDATPSHATTAINSEEVNVVPALVNYSVSDSFNTSGDNQAVIKVTVDKGENDISTLKLKELVFGQNVNTNLIKVNDQDFNGLSGSTITLNKEITGLSSFDITVQLAWTTSSGAVNLNEVKFEAINSDGAVSAFKAVTWSTSLGSYNSN